MKGEEAFAGVELVISDSHQGLKGAIQRVIGATRQRCRVHFMRNALAHVPRGQHTVVAAAIRQAFRQPDRTAAGDVWRQVPDRLRPHGRGSPRSWIAPNMTSWPT